MVNKIKNNSTQGIYITTEQGGSIAGNTPGEIDLDLLILGNQYIYFDSVMRFEYRISTTTEGGDSTFVGHNVSAITPGGLTSWTGQAEKGNVIIIAEVDQDVAYLIERFVKQNNRTGSDSGRFLVKQFASESFEEFPSDSLAKVKYLPVISSGCTVVEIEGVIGRKQVSIGFWEAQSA